MKPSKLIAAALAAWLALPGAPALADTAKPLALRGIMQELGQHMQTVALGIAREDWGLVAKTAPLIAKHPQPPFKEKTRILAFVGTDMGRFKRHDHNTHEAAQALGQAAEKQDGRAVITAFQAVQTSCLDCHHEFRKPFVEHFYGAR